MNFVRLEPKVYKLDKSADGKYYAAEYKDRFTVPERLYGKIQYRANRFWDSYTRTNLSLGVMLVGNSGSGKTALAYLLANRAIDNGTAVVVVADTPADMEMINFIDSLINVVVLFDEYEKYFPIGVQNKMLTTFSGLSGRKKFFIITANNEYKISEFIRDRTGRMRYRINYERVEQDVVEEYCADKKVDKKFFDDLMAKYKESSTFSFDHLETIVDEHIKYPNDSFEDIISILNASVLNKPATYTVVSVYDPKNEKYIPFYYPDKSIKKRYFEYGDRIGLTLFPKTPKLNKIIKVNNENIVNIEDGKITLQCQDTGYLINIDRMPADNIINPPEEQDNNTELYAGDTSNSGNFSRF